MKIDSIQKVVNFIEEYNIHDVVYLEYEEYRTIVEEMSSISRFIGPKSEYENLVFREQDSMNLRIFTVNGPVQLNMNPEKAKNQRVKLTTKIGAELYD